MKRFRFTYKRIAAGLFILLSACGSNGSTQYVPGKTVTIYVTPSPTPVQNPSPSPSSTPTLSPSPTPTPGPIIAPAIYLGGGQPTTGSSTVSELGYSGTFSEVSDNCTSIVNEPIAQVGATFTATQITGGTCVVLVQDTLAHQASIVIYSTTSSIGIH